MICYSKVKFLGKNGHEKEREKALRLLEISKEYIVESIVIGNYKTDIYLNGPWDDEGYNSVMFEGVEGSEI